VGLQIGAQVSDFIFVLNNGALAQPFRVAATSSWALT
jgi:lipid-binding SYLF domain-containing protein